MSSNAPNALIARLKQPSRPPNAVIAEGRSRGKTSNTSWWSFGNFFFSVPGEKGESEAPGGGGDSVFD